jgi:uncharacterized protein (TIGR02246 family)
LSGTARSALHGPLILCCLALAQFFVPASRAEEAAAEIRSALTAWMEDFNAGRADETCKLFAPDLRANVRGQPERGYDAQCELLKRSLADDTKTYAYALDINEIMVFGEFAVVRLVWTLTVKQKDGAETTSIEPGLDVFKKQPDGRWQIVRYMAYEQ